MPTKLQVEQIQPEILLTLLVRLIGDINTISLIRVQAGLQVDLRADPRADLLAEMAGIHAIHDTIIVVIEGETTRPTRRLPMSRLLKATTKTTKRTNAIAIAFSSFHMDSNRTLSRWLLAFLLKSLLSTAVALFSLKLGFIMSSRIFD